MAISRFFGGSVRAAATLIYMIKKYGLRVPRLGALDGRKVLEIRWSEQTAK